MKKILVLEGNIVARKRFLNKFKKSLSEYDLFYFDKQDNYEYVSQMISELSCFDEKRLFIIKDLPSVKAPSKAQERTKVLNYFKKLFPIIPNGNIVVFDNVGISAESFFKEVRKCGEVHIFDKKIDKSEARRVIKKYFNKKEISLDGDIIALIANSLNLEGKEVDVDKLDIMLKKFHHYIAGKKNITTGDYNVICSASKEFIIWNFYNFIDDKDILSSTKLITNYLNNAKYFRQESVNLINSMVWRFGLLLLISNGVNKKMSEEDIISAISNIKKVECSGKAQNMRLTERLKEDKNIQEYSLKMMKSVIERRHGKEILSCYNFNQLILIYYTLVQTLIKIRSGCTDAEIRIAIQMNILVICGKIVKKNTIDGVLDMKKVLFGV